MGRRVRVTVEIIDDDAPIETTFELRYDENDNPKADW